MIGYVLLWALEWTARVTVLLGGAWLLSLGLRRASAAVRHLLWVTGLVGALGIPVVAAVVPWQWTVRPPAAVERMRSALVPAALPEDRALGRGTATAAPAPPVATGSTNAAGVPPAPAAPSGRGLAIFAVLTWLSGAAAVLGLLVRSMLHVARLEHRAIPPDVPGWGDRMRRLAEGAGAGRDIQVLESDDVGLPLAVGLRRPVVLLPAGAAAEWPLERVEAVVLHELAHVRRRDLPARILARVVCAFQWFNPLSWIAERHLARESERACDDEVLRSGTRASAYAEHLLEIVRAGRLGPLPAAGLSMARRSELEGRLLALLDPGTRRSRVGWGAGLLTAAVAGAMLLAVAVPSARGYGNGAAAEAPALEPPQEGGTEALVADAARRDETEEAVVGTLIQLLGDADPRVREASARALGERRAAGAVPPLVAALADGSDEVREEAAAALGYIGHPDAVEPLARLLMGDRDEDVREAAAWALGETESAVAVERLRAALDVVGHDRLREDVVRALGETGRPEAVGVLTALLAESDRRLQRRVLESLVEIGGEEALNAVIAAMQSDDPGLRRAAARALGRGG